MSALKLFEQKHIRSAWDEKEEKWYFSIVDVVGVLTESPDARNYWKVLKHRLLKEGNQSVTNCNQLKMQSAKLPAIPENKLKQKPARKLLAQVMLKNLTKVKCQKK